jgi:hypothetical protein
MDFGTYTLFKENNNFNPMKFKRILFVIIFSTSNCFGQFNSVKERISIKASIARYPTNIWIGTKDGKGFYNKKTLNYRLEGSYGFHKNIEGLFYFGGQNDNFIINNDSVTNIFLPYFGFGVNYHILPHINLKKEMPLDFYLTAKFGGLYVRKDSNPLYSGLMPEVSAGVGGAFYFFGGFGIYGELAFGKFYFRNDAFPLANKFNSGKDWYKIESAH